jgi:hypothetical protein
MSLVQVSAEKIAALQSRYPALPPIYCEYLRTVGWGETQSGRMVYEDPIAPNDVYGPSCALSSVVLLGDDFQGYCLAYNLDTKRFGEVTPTGKWEEWPSGHTFQSYVGV